MANHEYKSNEKKTSTLGAKTFAEQMAMIEQLGLRNYVSRAFDTVDPNASPEQIQEDFTRDLGFDLADHSELSRMVAQRLMSHVARQQKSNREVKASMDKANLHKVVTDQPEGKTGAQAQPDPVK